MFASDDFEKDFLIQNSTLNVKCYSNMDEVSIYNQMFVSNGQIKKKEELNVYFSLDFFPIPCAIYPEILIISPYTNTANMKTERKCIW